jgi:hypothetical protein
MPNDKDSGVVDKEEVLKQARILWQKYFALTKELLKFSGQEENSDLFIELVNQRERIIEKMKELPENDYRKSEECQKLIEQILPMDKQIIYRAKAWLNRSRRQNSMVRSYDLMESAGFRGSVLNRKY